MLTPAARAEFDDLLTRYRDAVLAVATLDDVLAAPVSEDPSEPAVRALLDQELVRLRGCELGAKRVLRDWVRVLTAPEP